MAGLRDSSLRLSGIVAPALLLLVCILSSPAPAAASSVPGRPTAEAPLGTIARAMPVFRWSPAARASDYELRVFAAGKPLFSKTLIAQSPWQCRRPLPNGAVLTWQVRAHHAAGYGPWSTGLDFNIGPLYQPYFGDLHTQTSFSDGTGSPPGAYASGLAAGMDFFAVTDHSTYLTPKEWSFTRAAAAAATTAEFVGIAAYELSWDRHHINTFAVKSVIPKSTDVTTGLPAVDFIDPLLAYPGAIGQFDHPNWKGYDAFDHFTGRTDERDAVMDLLEIYNGLGDEYYEGSYVECLDQGWHVTPTANSDAHLIDWDSAVAPYDYRTVLLAHGLTRRALFDAMRASRGYASMDRDLHVGFTVDGAVMGSTIARAPEHVVWINVDDPDARVPGDQITKLEVISDSGAVVDARKVNGHSVTWTPSVHVSAANYFWLRVTAADGVAAWTAPVWIGR
jgi:trimeric autotransporter adhesin